MKRPAVSGFWQLLRILLVFVLGTLWFISFAAIYIEFDPQIQGPILIAIVLISGFMIFFFSRVIIRFLMARFPD
jgi:hypothetical protein